MSAGHGYLVEPWCVTERGLELDMLARSESVFALANGHIGLRGNLDEGDPHGLPGTYLNSVYELRPLPYAEAGYGYMQSGQTVINVTNGKLIRLLVDDEPFDIRYGTLDSHERVLDLRAGTLTRQVQWTSPAHDTVCISSVRLVSLTQRAVAAIAYEVEPVGDGPLRIVKFLAYGWSSQRTRPALHDQVVAALAGARLSGWDGLLAEQRAYLDEFWAGADVEIDGDAEIQQAVRFGLFHILQAGARAEQRPIPAKGLTGPGYDGHTFWDTETFVLPVLTYTQPDAAADVLRWRQLTLPIAKERAGELGLEGAAFPWRTLRGWESSGYWPASTAAFHINADIADAVVRYVDATEDEDFERDVAVELLVETARLWRSLGHHDIDGNFRIDGVTGPDEYSAVADNNVFTNLMAQHNL